MNMTPELREYIEFVDKYYHLIPRAWRIDAVQHDGTLIGVSKSAQEPEYEIYEDAERAVQEVLKWAKSAEIRETHNENIAGMMFKQYLSTKADKAALPESVLVEVEKSKRFRVKLLGFRSGSESFIGKIGLLEPQELSINGDIMSALFYPYDNGYDGYGGILWPRFQSVDY